jgi:hypothetical protein
LSVF